jgi:transposase InsO family protein
VLCSTDENPLKITNIEKYQIIDRLRNEYQIERLANALGITSRAYRKWVSKGKPIMNNYNQEIADVILVEHYEQKEVYGTFRLKAHLAKKFNILLNHKLITRYKKALQLKVVVRRKNPISNKLSREKSLAYMAKNLLKCNFTSERPYQKLSTDVSYIKCTDGYLYLSAVKDLFNNEIVSYSYSEKNDVSLVIESISKLPPSSGVIHSDQGSQYYSWEYRKKLDDLGYKRSMSRKGACWENSPIENWFSQLKEECIRNGKVGSKKEIIIKIKEYVQWYNHERIQKSLGYLSPMEFRQVN